MALLDVSNLNVEFPTRHGTLHALRDVSFTLDKGERLGIVGESGAGKSLAAFAIINLLSKPGRISGGTITFEGQDLTAMDTDALRSIRGNRISMIFQDPMMTLNPVLTIGTQMVETLQAHRRISHAEAKRIAIAKLREVTIPSPEERFDSYPHELSGGMRQRVVIAIALLTDPSIIIADEPTTALDVTIQAEIMALMLDLCETHDVGLILITHDLGVVSEVTQRVNVMYAGRVIETGSTRDIIDAPKHPYTRGLIAALPQQNEAAQRLNQIPGSMPSLDGIPPGCAFNPRCPHVGERCRREIPALRALGEQQVACHSAEEVAALAGNGGSAS
ncbi:MAG: ABC transporter ATP-binding protein [Rhodobacterales bacterium]|nr:ABC transporter ATP-binding protein [Rhodobacterales bacterium]